MSTEEYADELLAARAMLVRDLASQWLVREFVAVAPAVGTDIIQAVPAGAYWEVLELSFMLQTSGAAANRRVLLGTQTVDGANGPRIESNGTEAASTNVRYSFLQGMGAFYGGDGFGIPLPSDDWLLLPSSTIRTLTSSLQAGDQFSASYWKVREWSPQRVAWASRYAAQTLYEQRDA